MTALRVAVTGATGFTGEHLVRRLVAEGHRVTAVVRRTSRRGAIAALVEGFAVADLGCPAEVERAVGGHDALVHMADLGFESAPDYVAAVERAGVGRAVFTGTTAMLTRLPVRSKPVREAAERAVERSHLRWTVIRPTMIYGTARDRNIARLLRFLRRYRCMVLPAGGRALQQPVHVADVADAAVRALLCERAVRRSYNLSGKHPLSFRSLVEEAGRAVGLRPVLVSLPVPLLAGLAGVAGQARIPTRLSAEQVLRIAEDKAFDHAEAVRDFGFRTRSFEAGVDEEARLLGLRA